MAVQRFNEIGGAGARTKKLTRASLVQGMTVAAKRNLTAIAKIEQGTNKVYAAFSKPETEFTASQIAKIHQALKKTAKYLAREHRNTFAHFKLSIAHQIPNKRIVAQLEDIALLRTKVSTLLAQAAVSMGLEEGADAEAPIEIDENGYVVGDNDPATDDVSDDAMTPGDDLEVPPTTGADEDFLDADDAIPAQASRKRKALDSYDITPDPQTSNLPPGTIGEDYQPIEGDITKASRRTAVVGDDVPLENPESLPTASRKAADGDDTPVCDGDDVMSDPAVQAAIKAAKARRLKTAGEIPEGVSGSDEAPIQDAQNPEGFPSATSKQGAQRRASDCDPAEAPNPAKIPEDPTASDLDPDNDGDVDSIVPDDLDPVTTDEGVEGADEGDDLDFGGDDLDLPDTGIDDIIGGEILNDEGLDNLDPELTDESGDCTVSSRASLRAKKLGTAKRTAIASNRTSEDDVLASLFA